MNGAAPICAAHRMRARPAPAPDPGVSGGVGLVAGSVRSQERVMHRLSRLFVAARWSPRSGQAGEFAQTAPMPGMALTLPIPAWPTEPQPCRRRRRPPAGSCRARSHRRPPAAPVLLAAASVRRGQLPNQRTGPNTSTSCTTSALAADAPTRRDRARPRPEARRGRAYCSARPRVLARIQCGERMSPASVMIQGCASSASIARVAAASASRRVANGRPSADRPGERRDQTVSSAACRDRRASSARPGCCGASQISSVPV